MPTCATVHFPVKRLHAGVSKQEHTSLLHTQAPGPPVLLLHNLNVVCSRLGHCVLLRTMHISMRVVREGMAPFMWMTCESMLISASLDNKRVTEFPFSMIVDKNNGSSWCTFLINVWVLTAIKLMAFLLGSNYKTCFSRSTNVFAATPKGLSPGVYKHHNCQDKRNIGCTCQPLGCNSPS